MIQFAHSSQSVIVPVQMLCRPQLGVQSCRMHPGPKFVDQMACRQHRLIVVLERCTIVHALETLELLRTLETAPNPRVRNVIMMMVFPCARAHNLRIHAAFSARSLSS